MTIYLVYDKNERPLYYEIVDGKSVRIAKADIGTRKVKEVDSEELKQIASGKTNPHRANGTEIASSKTQKAPTTKKSPKTPRAEKNKKEAEKKECGMIPSVLLVQPLPGEKPVMFLVPKADLTKDQWKYLAEVRNILNPLAGSPSRYRIFTDLDPRFLTEEAVVNLKKKPELPKMYLLPYMEQSEQYYVAEEDGAIDNSFDTGKIFEKYHITRVISYSPE